MDELLLTIHPGYGLANNPDAVHECLWGSRWGACRPR